MKKLFQGEFEYTESSHTLIPHCNWEFVIVCPNPDNTDLKKSLIGEAEATKWFKKSFRPEFSKKFSVLRQNQQAELDAFRQAFSNLPIRDNERLFKGGGRFVKENSEFIDTEKPAGDYLSLMRYILLVKLGFHLGLHTKQIMSSNNKYFYRLVCADDEDLKNEAESTNYSLELEIGEIDLISLEPCDERLRPFRLLACPQNSIIELKSEIENEFSTIMN